MKRPRIGITLGDPRGIGPEITGKALSVPEISDAADFVLIGPAGVAPAGYPVVDVGGWDGSSDSETAGRLAGEAIAKGIELAMSGEIAGIVTAPIDKSAFRAGGWSYPGHTEMLQALTGSRSVAMMMAAERSRLGGPLRIVLATTHLPLREVATVLTDETLLEQTRLAHHALLSWWGIASPRIALCAFNPHASDGGLFGDEEERIYAPAIACMEHEGLRVAGPIPADTVFRRALEGEFDAVIAPYHDVGMAPFKTVAFGGGVNVTLGLPFPRTSPDHGTALDIAGRGIASSTSMEEAIRLAVRLARGFDTPRARL